MVGRTAEADRVWQAVASAERGDPSFVVIEGEAGIGKTRLAAELVARLGARREPALVLSGHGIAVPSGELPFGLLSELLRDLSHRVGLEQLRALLGSEAYALAGLVPALDVGAVRPGPVDRTAVFGTTVDLLRQLSQDRLVVVWLDDLQWSDEASLDVFEYVGRVVHQGRLLLLTTVRLSNPGDDPFSRRLAELHALPRSHVVRLDRLKDEEVAEQVRHLLASDVRPDAVARICRLSDGVPFLAEELVASGAAAESRLPSSVRRLVLTRLPELSADARDVIDAAVVGEGHVHHRLLLRASGMTPSRFEAAITPCIEAGIVEVSDDGDRYGFRHALMREVLEQAMHPSRRIQWHERWATALSEAFAPIPANQAAILVARHWDAAGADDAAWRSAIAAAHAASQLGAPAQEAELWEQAFRLWPPGVEHMDGVTLGEVAVKKVRAMLFAAQFDDVLRWARSALESGVEDAALELWFRLVEQWSGGLIAAPTATLPTPEEAPEMIERLAAMGTSWPTMDAIDGIWHSFPQLHTDLFDRVDGLLDQMAHELGDDHMIRGIMRHRAMHALETGHADVALRHVHAELEHARLRSPLDLRIAQANLARVLLASGAAARAVEFGSASLATFDAPEAAPFLWTALAMHQGRGLLALGRLDEATTLIDRAIEVAGHDVALRGMVVPLWIKARARSGEDAAAALADLERVSSTQVLTDGVWSWHWTGYADVALASGDISLIERQRPMLTTEVLVPASDWAWEPILNGLRAMITPLAGGPPVTAEIAPSFEAAAVLNRHGDLGLAWSREVAALAARAAGTDDSQAWRDAADAWSHIAYPFDEAICRLRFGECLLREGDRTAATRELALALSIAERQSAVPLIEAILRMRRLGRLNLDQHRDGAGGGVGLTPREVEVLGLVAVGRTNNQIAEELYLSPKTVSVHVSRILTKLGASNRTEAVNLARSVGVIP